MHEQVPDQSVLLQQLCIIRSRYKCDALMPGGFGAHAAEAFQEGTLRALSTLCSDRESSRRQLVEARAIGPIVRCLNDANEKVGLLFT